MSFLQLIAILSVICSIYCAPTDTSGAFCQMPSDAELKAQLTAIQNASHPHETFMIVPPKQRELQKLFDTEVSDTFMEKYKQNLYGNKTCPKKIVSAGALGLEERSTCPWYYKINHDPLRYPRTLADAGCKNCTFCLTGDEKITFSNICETVKYPIRVLHRTGCTSGFYTYTEGWETIGVGCTCVVPKVHTNGADQTSLL